MNGQAIGNALYGLKCMSSAELEVRQVLKALLNKISESEDLIQGQNIGNALYGLKGMSSKDAEVRGTTMGGSRKARAKGRAACPETGPTDSTSSNTIGI